MVFGSFQGLVAAGCSSPRPAIPSCWATCSRPCRQGLLAGTLAYTALAPRLARRTWYVVSLVGMAASVLALGLLPAFPALLAAACALGFTSGPVSALLGFFMLDRIPAASRGSALGHAELAHAGGRARRSVRLVGGRLRWPAPPTAAFALAALWVVVTLIALAIRSMRSLDDEAILEGRDAA